MNCSGRGQKVNKTCICDDGFSGIDWFNNWNDCQTSTMLLIILNAGLIFSAFLLIMRSLYTLFILAPGTRGYERSPAFNSYRFKSILYYVRRFFFFTMIFGGSLLSRCILSLDMQPDRTSDIRVILDSIMWGSWQSSLTMTPVVWGIWTQNERILNFYNFNLILLILVMIWIFMISVAALDIVYPDKYKIIYYIMYCVIMLVVTIVNVVCASMRYRMLRLLKSFLQNTCSTNERSQLIYLKQTLTKIKWSAYFLTLLTMLGIAMPILTLTVKYFKQRIWMMILLTIQIHCIYSIWGSFFFKPKFLKGQMAQSLGASNTPMHNASSDESQRQPYLTSSGYSSTGKNYSATLVSETTRWWTRHQYDDTM